MRTLLLAIAAGTLFAVGLAAENTVPPVTGRPVTEADSARMARLIASIKKGEVVKAAEVEWGRRYVNGLLERNMDPKRLDEVRKLARERLSLSEEEINLAIAMRLAQIEDIVTRTLELLHKAKTR